jgi:hypothetical protein
MRESEMQYTRQNLLNDLKLHAVEVRFTKVNGEKRVMHCTLQPHLLPPQTDIQKLEEAHDKNSNTDTIAVWDLQNGGWRSFRVDSVEYVQAIDGY